MSRPFQSQKIAVILQRFSEMEGAAFLCVNESLPLAVVYPIGISKGLRVAKPAFLQPTSNTPTDAIWSGILEGLMLLSPKREDASRIKNDL